VRALLLLLILPLWADFQVLPPRLLTHAPEMELTLSAPARPLQALSWRFVFERQTLAQGTVQLDAQGQAPLRFQTPPPRGGLPLELELILSRPQDGPAPQSHKVWIFPEEAWAGGKDWVKDWPLWLYDPTGDTAAWLERHKLPFRRIPDLSAVRDGALLVGEGMNLHQPPDWMDRLIELSSSGVPVLVLAPAKGMLDLSAARGEGAMAGMRFAGLEFVTARDPRLKAAGFPPLGFQLAADRGRVRLATGAEEGWSFVQIAWEGRAPLVFCGLPIITHDADSPAGILLLQTLLNALGERTPTPAPSK